MAGKVKNKDEGLQSKTARASMRGSGARNEFIAAADAPRIVPLGGGTHAYVLDPRDGKTRRFSVSSEEFFEMLAVLDGAGHGDRLKRDIADLAARYPVSPWTAVLARLETPAVEEIEEAGGETGDDEAAA
jgi:hypothetical protein